MVQAHGLPELLARVLAGRGVRPAGSDAYLKPRLRDLMPDPDCLVDMDAAAERLARAVRHGESVAVFGDYDVDGAASAALLAGYLRRLGVPTRIHIPDRITEGYGPNTAAVAALAGEGARLLVCVDCGTSGHGPLEEAERIGLDVIVARSPRRPREPAAGACAREPEPPRRPVRPRASLRRGRRVPDAGGAGADAPGPGVLRIRAPSRR